MGVFNDLLSRMFNMNVNKTQSPFLELLKGKRRSLHCRGVLAVGLRTVGESSALSTEEII